MIDSSQLHKLIESGEAKNKVLYYAKVTFSWSRSEFKSISIRKVGINETSYWWGKPRMKNLDTGTIFKANYSELFFTIDEAIEKIKEHLGLLRNMLSEYSNLLPEIEALKIK